MTARVGDLIVVKSERVVQAARKGVIEEVLQEQPARFRVRWEDGHTSIFAPCRRSGEDRGAEEGGEGRTAAESAQANATPENRVALPDRIDRRRRGGRTVRRRETAVAI
jgi:hypothetical protein